MASPADRQADANAAVERIAKGMFEVMRSPWRWTECAEDTQESWRRYARTLLRRGVIKPGDPPSVERPMEGQTTIEEQLQP